jgi:hypothetical protein
MIAPYGYKTLRGNLLALQVSLRIPAWELTLKGPIEAIPLSLCIRHETAYKASRPPTVLFSFI